MIAMTLFILIYNLFIQIRVGEKKIKQRTKQLKRGVIIKRGGVIQHHTFFG